VGVRVRMGRAPSFLFMLGLLAFALGKREMGLQLVAGECRPATPLLLVVSVILSCAWTFFLFDRSMRRLVHHSMGWMQHNPSASRSSP
jgi:hypothetical protein